MEEQSFDLILGFQNFNRMLDFYITGLNKTRDRAMRKILNLKNLGLLSINEDGTVSATYHFKTREKYDKYLDSYVFISW